MSYQSATTDQVSELTHAALERVSVAAPYFGLTDLAFGSDGQSLTASVPSRALAAPEVGAIAAAQAARHLAILGSCAAALTSENDQRHHYLAVGANYERLGAAVDAPDDEPMRATAHASWQDKRTATATTTLASATGEPLIRLDVTCAVMKPNMFRRLNPQVDVPAGATPAADGPIVVEQSLGSVIADYGPVHVGLCEGHFPEHPVAPIAIVMGRLVLTARHALCSYLGAEVDYRVEGGTVEASGLAQPGQRLVLEAQYESEQADGTHLLTGRALADDVEVGAVQVQLAAIART